MNDCLVRHHLAIVQSRLYSTFGGLGQVNQIERKTLEKSDPYNALELPDIEGYNIAANYNGHKYVHNDQNTLVF